VTLTLRYAARSDVGLIRSTNEDAVYAGPRLLAVADGMGGHAAGDVASAVAIATLAPLDDDEPPADILGALEQAIRQANDQLRQMMEADTELDGMGTTLTALLWGGTRVGLAHIGDSRAYLLRDGELTQITHDHTLVQRLVDEGQLDEADIPTHPQRSVILRVLNGRPEDTADLSIRDVRAGDRFLICSDGLSGVVSKQTIQDTLATPDPREAVDALVELALRGGAPDNVTCIVCDVVDSGQPPLGEPYVGGSAADEADVAEPSARTAAGRAAALRGRRRPQLRRYFFPDDTPRRRWRGPALVLGLLILVAGGIFGGTWLYSQHQFYVGSERGHVVVYRGIKDRVLGLSFSSAVERTDVEVAQLPAFQRERVLATIPAPNRAAADRIVAQLQQATEPSINGTSSPPPSLTPSAATSPAVSNTAGSSPGGSP
jgi:PPM family protein phosphatase